MGLKKSTRQAYSELYGFLEYLDEETRNKVPLKLREFFKNEKDNEYYHNMDFVTLLNKHTLKRETLALIALLNLQYWCDDEKEKKRLWNVYNSNEEKYQKIIQEKYSVENLFNNKKDEDISNVYKKNINNKENQDEIRKEEGLIDLKNVKWYMKFWNYILKNFRKK